MKSKTTTLTLILCLLGIGIFAHEFWLEPQKFILKVGEKINFRIFVGENFHGELVDFSEFKVQKFIHYSPVNEKNTKGQLSEKQLSDFLVFDTEGNHLIAFNNTNKFIGLPANQFNGYLKDDGLEYILAYRKEHHQLADNSREVYQRCAKTLLQVGNKHTDIYKKNTGMRLELIPDANPYETRNQKLTFQVLFDNKPVKDALVVVWHKGNNVKTTIQKYRSDTDGKISFSYVKKDRWMVSTVKMIENANKQEADWQSYWGSYTFGF